MRVDFYQVIFHETAGLSFVPLKGVKKVVEACVCAFGYFLWIITVPCSDFKLGGHWNFSA